MSKENNFIQVNGIMSLGYGFSPKAVMTDTRLDIESKAIYAYMSSFAGAGLTAFPSVERQYKQLKISKTRYYKYRKQLEDLGYITIKQTRTVNEKGKSVQGNNIYTLEQYPIAKIVEEDQKAEIPQNKDTQQNSPQSQLDEIPQNEDTQNANTQNADSHTKDSNSNSFESNILNSNNTISSSSKEEIEEDPLIEIMNVCQLYNLHLKKVDAIKLLATYKDLDLIIEAIAQTDLAKENIQNAYKYVLRVIKDLKEIKTTNVNVTVEGKKDKLKFDNFEQRKYDYDDLEKKMLGWDKDEDPEDEAPEDHAPKLNIGKDYKVPEHDFFKDNRDIPF